MKLDSEIRKIAQKWGIDHFGIADLNCTRQLASQDGGQQEIYPKAISIGLNLFHDIVDQLPNRKTQSVSIAYKHHCYNVINYRLDLIASDISSQIQRSGYRVFPIPASKRISDQNLTGAFSHKMAANLCGLGWIGKSCLLVTPTNGPRVRFATILTNAPIESTGNEIDNKCDGCQECVDVCPAKAFTGRSFNKNEKRELRYDAHKCDQYFNRIRKVHNWAMCGMCVYVCPFGQQNK